MKYRKMPFFLPLLLIAAAMSSPAIAGGNSPDSPDEARCGDGEKTWLQATVEKSGKMIALCGGVNAKGDPTWLQFRTGMPGRLDFVFPIRRAGSLKTFTVRRYTRPRTTYHKFHFETGGMSHAILEFHSADEQPPYGAQYRIRRISDEVDLSEEDLKMESPQLHLMRLQYRVRTKPFDE